MGLGMASQPGRQAVAHTSFAQLRLLAVLAAISSAAFTMLLILDTVDVADWSLPVGSAVPALTFPCSEHFTRDRRGPHRRRRTLHGVVYIWQSAMRGCR